MIGLPLDQPGRRLLKILVGHFPNVKPGRPQTYVGYKASRLDPCN